MDVCLLFTKFKISNNRTPEIAILNAEIAKGEIPNKSVRYSIRIDSHDRRTANKKTIHDFLINITYYGKICLKINLP
jgi:hypothetical protein